MYFVFAVPPEDVVISIKPKDLHVGMQAIIQCNATVSNPVAEITWWLNGLPVTDGITSTSQPGLYGGKLAFSELILDVTAEMNGNTITCQATNPVLAQSKSIFDTLSVKCTFRCFYVVISLSLLDRHE